MRIIIEPLVEVLDPVSDAQLIAIERAGRTCYKSGDAQDGASARAFIRMIIKRGHESVLEHEKLSVRFTVDRGVSHEIVRHRLAAYSQESTRYCNYAGDRFGREITVIRPPWWAEDDGAFRAFSMWHRAMAGAEGAYLQLIDAGATPEQARSVLPNSLKTEIVVTYNLREWRHFFRLRTAAAAHPQMRQVATPLLRALQTLPTGPYDAVFEDLVPGGDPVTPWAQVLINGWTVTSVAGDRCWTPAR